jgi:tRNA pseudouridine55 synthase
VDGFLFVDKPAGPASFAVVKQVRSMLGGAKIGHAGTLDPLASGLLICALGSATRLLPYLPAEPKRYAFAVRFGSETDTLDADGAVTAEGGHFPSRKELEDVCVRFTGNVAQVPPRFSAVKVDGRRAYELARKNAEFEIKERTVTVFSLSVSSYSEAAAEAGFEVACSGGTYVRSLVRDMAHALGTLAFASFIRRLAIGPFSVDKAISLENVADIRRHIMTVQEALSSIPSVTITQEQCGTIATGRTIGLDMNDAVVIAYTDAGAVAGVLIKSGTREYHPEKVFI